MAWIDGPDPLASKGRAHVYRIWTWVLSILFAAQMALLAASGQPATGASLAGPLAALFLALACLVMAYDHRRHWLEARKAAPPDPSPPRP